MLKNQNGTQRIGFNNKKKEVQLVLIRKDFLKKFNLFNNC